MKRTLIAELGGKVGERVSIRGWVNAIRDQKRMQFLVIRDESGLAQVVLGKDDPPSVQCLKSLDPEGERPVNCSVIML